MELTQLRAWARDYWRIPVVAALGGLLAFMASFVVPKEYASSTRLLVRGREATFLTDKAQDLSDQPGVIDSTLAKALGETQSALLSTRSVAEMVVDDLKLDQLPTKSSSGPIGTLRGAVVGVYKRARAIATHGFYKEPTKREAAIDGVYAGLAAGPLKDSYVLELRATADDAKLAAAIADSAADALVTVGSARFREEADRNRTFLEGQVERARKEVDAAETELRNYKEEHGISDVALQIELNTRSADELGTQLRDATVALNASRAELRSVDQSLDKVSPTISSTNSIRTGRSTTNIESTIQDSAYQELLVKRETVRAEVASLEAKQAALTRLVDPAAAATLTAEQAQVQQLQLAVTSANQTFGNVSAQYQRAVLTSQEIPVELSRVDKPGVPLYPVKPVRYLYLVMGTLCGALLALGLTLLDERRRRAVARPSENGTTASNGGGPMVFTAPAPSSIPPAPVPSPMPTPVPAPFTMSPTEIVRPRLVTEPAPDLRSRPGDPR